MIQKYNVKACKRCTGTGEEYRPDLPCSDGPWLDCLGCHGYGFEQSEASTRHCTALLAESWRTGWPEFFRADVEYHDMTALAERNPNLPFVWMLRQMGSTILFTEITSIEVCLILIRAQDAECRFYYWDGTALHVLTRDATIEKVSSENKKRS